MHNVCIENVTHLVIEGMQPPLSPYVPPKHTREHNVMYVYGVTLHPQIIPPLFKHQELV